MKKFCSLFAILFLISAVAFAQDKQEKMANETPANGPVMAFETEEIDYGTIEQHADPLRTFKFTNTGNEPLQITNAKGSCGCTVPTWPKEPIFPGESGAIEVRYDTKRIGKFVKRVTLTTNAGPEKIVLTIKGQVNKKAPEPDGVPSSQPSILSPAGGNK
ncbi:MAG: DUF1573 domain-containing protein [Bacteroidota bacterium]